MDKRTNDGTKLQNCPLYKEFITQKYSTGPHEFEESRVVKSNGENQMHFIKDFQKHLGINPSKSTEAAFLQLNQMARMNT